MFVGLVKVQVGRSVAITGITITDPDAGDQTRWMTLLVAASTGRIPAALLLALTATFWLTCTKGLYLDPSFLMAPNGTLEPLKAVSTWLYQGFSSKEIVCVQSARDAWMVTLPSACREAALICRPSLMRCAWSPGALSQVTAKVESMPGRQNLQRALHKVSASRHQQSHIWNHSLLTNRGPRQRYSHGKTRVPVHIKSSTRAGHRLLHPVRHHRTSSRRDATASGCRKGRQPGNFSASRRSRRCSYRCLACKS